MDKVITRRAERGREKERERGEKDEEEDLCLKQLVMVMVTKA